MFKKLGLSLCAALLCAFAHAQMVTNGQTIQSGQIAAQTSGTASIPTVVTPFASSASSTSAGTPVTLTASISGATTQIVTRTDISGTTTVCNTPTNAPVSCNALSSTGIGSGTFSNTSTFTLHACNANGCITPDATVVVTVVPIPTVSLSATCSTCSSGNGTSGTPFVMASNAPKVLGFTWTTTNAATCKIIVTGLADIVTSPCSSGSLNFTPGGSYLTSAVYQMQVTGNGNTVTSAGIYVTVTQVAAAGLDATYGIDAVTGTTKFYNHNSDGTSNTSNKSYLDGPAELPRLSIATAMSATPNGTHIGGGTATTWTASVGGGGPCTSGTPTGCTLQQTLNNAVCGDTIIWPASPDGGATQNVYAAPSNGLILPPNSCDDAHWIIVRTDAIANAHFPGEGVRMTPCSAGMGATYNSGTGRAHDVPNYPDYNCYASPLVLIPKVTVGSTANKQLITVASVNTWPTLGHETEFWNLTNNTPGTSHYRFIGIEFSGVRGQPEGQKLVEIPGCDKCILDRLWLVGNDPTIPITVTPAVSSVTATGGVQTFTSSAALDSRIATGKSQQAVFSGCSGSTTTAVWNGTYFLNTVSSPSFTVINPLATGTVSGCSVKVILTPEFDPVFETQALVGFQGATRSGLINSWLQDAVCVGNCIDSQAFIGGTGQGWSGAHMIDNNLLSASGESWIYGGGPAAHICNLGTENGVIGVTGTGWNKDCKAHDVIIADNDSMKSLAWFLAQSTSSSIAITQESSSAVGSIGFINTVTLSTPLKDAAVNVDSLTVTGVTNGGLPSASCNSPLNANGKAIATTILSISDTTVTYLSPTSCSGTGGGNVFSAAKLNVSGGGDGSLMGSNSNHGILKNLGETKATSRALWEKNYIHNSGTGWYTDQFGNGHLFTPKNQSVIIQPGTVTVKITQPGGPALAVSTIACVGTTCTVTATSTISGLVSGTNGVGGYFTGVSNSAFNMIPGGGGSGSTPAFKPTPTCDVTSVSTNTFVCTSSVALPASATGGTFHPAVYADAGVCSGTGCSTFTPTNWFTCDADAYQTVATCPTGVTISSFVGQSGEYPRRCTFNDQGVTNGFDACRLGIPKSNSGGSGTTPSTTGRWHILNFITATRVELWDESGSPNFLSNSIPAGTSGQFCKRGSDPFSVARDTVIRFELGAHMANAIQVATAESGCGDTGLGIARLSLHDSAYDDVDPSAFHNNQGSGCCGLGWGVEIESITTNQAAVPSDISIRNNDFLIKDFGGSNHSGISNIFDQRFTGTNSPQDPLLGTVYFPRITFADNFGMGPMSVNAGGSCTKFLASPTSPACTANGSIKGGMMAVYGSPTANGLVNNDIDAIFRNNLAVQGIASSTQWNNLLDGEPVDAHGNISGDDVDRCSRVAPGTKTTSGTIDACDRKITGYGDIVTTYSPQGGPPNSAVFSTGTFTANDLRLPSSSQYLTSASTGGQIGADISTLYALTGPNYFPTTYAALNVLTGTCGSGGAPTCPKVGVPYPPTSLAIGQALEPPYLGSGASPYKIWTFGGGASSPTCSGSACAPPGMALTSVTGILSGTPTTAGTYVIFYTVEDLSHQVNSGTITLIVAP